MDQSRIPPRYAVVLEQSSSSAFESSMRVLCVDVCITQESRKGSTPGYFDFKVRKDGSSGYFRDSIKLPGGESIMRRASTKVHYLHRPML
jgi:hypothetical protein